LVLAIARHIVGPCCIVGVSRWIEFVSCVSLRRIQAKRP
jgi:hypothetical protein